MPPDHPTMARRYKSYKAPGTRPPPPPIFNEVSATATNASKLGKPVISFALIHASSMSDYLLVKKKSYKIFSMFHMHQPELTKSSSAPRSGWEGITL